MRADAPDGASEHTSTKDEQTTPGGAGFASPEELRAAWDGLIARQEARGKAPPVGVDGVRAATFAARLEQNLAEVHRVLSRRDAEGRTSWAFAPWLCRTLGPADARKREIYVPRLRDQLVLRLVAERLGAAMRERGLPCGPPSQATCARFMRRALTELEGGWFLRADVQRFYETAPRAAVLDDVRRLGLHDDVACLLERVFEVPARQPFAPRGSERPVPSGLPTGLSVSSLLGELLLARVDMALAGAGVRHVRFVDDLLVVARTEPEIQRAAEALEGALDGLGLRLSASKVQRGPLAAGVSFLGLEASAAGVRLAPARVSRWLASRQRELRATVAAVAATPGHEARLVLLEALVRGLNAEVSGAQGRLLPVAGAAGDTASLAELDRVLRLSMGGLFRRLGVKPAGRFRLERAETWGYRWRRSPRSAREAAARLYGTEASST